jgi:DNA invertase Pin-like site-specific DNA recombinase
MLTVLGGFAGFERELIRARTGEGRKRAQARGVRFGPKPKLTAHQRQEPKSHSLRTTSSPAHIKPTLRLVLLEAEQAADYLGWE